MAGTLIDSLVVSLGLDASQFTKGQAQARGELKKSSEAAHAGSKEMTAAANAITDAYKRVRNELLGLFALMTAGRGVRQLATDITNSDAAVGRMATRLGLATEELSAWEGVAVRAGGTADGISGSMASLSDEFERFKLTGQGMEDVIPILNRLHVSLTDPSGRLKSVTELYRDLADPLKALSAPQAAVVGQSLHMDPGTVAMLRQGRAAVDEQLAAQTRHGVATDADAHRAQALQNDFRDITQSVESIGRIILTAVSPALDDLLKKFDRWLDDNRDWLTDGITQKIEEFVTYLRSVDWNAILAGIKEFASIANAIATSIGGWTTALEVFFGLWAVGKLGPVLAGVASLVSAIELIGPAIVGIGLAAFAHQIDELVPSLRRLDDATTDWLRSFFGLSPIVRGAPGTTVAPGSPVAPGSAPAVPAAPGGPSPVSAVVPAEGRALLDAIAPGESDGTYRDQANPTSGARGRYQFLASTWNEVAGQTGRREWTPENQDANAWFYAQQMFRRNGGPGDLSTFLRNGGNPAPYLNRTWTSLPGGSEPNRATPGFQSRLDADRRRSQDPVVDPSALARGVTTPMVAPHPVSMLLPRPGALLQSLASNDTTNTNQTTVSGPITIHTAATDARGIAADLRNAIQRAAFTAQFNRGLA